MAMRGLLLVAALCGAVPAAASTAAAETAMLAAAAAACRTASGLRGAAVAGPAIGFSDVSAMTALLVTGTWRPRHMKGARATMLCLYDRRARTAEVQEAKGWTAPR